METNKELIKHLNELLEKNIDAVRGYKEAADDVKNPSLKTFLERNASARQSFTQDLRQEIVSLGGDPKDDTSVAADLHRGWINFKSAIAGHDEESVLEECIRGEEAALSEYDDVMKDYEIPQGLRNKIQTQRDQIQQNHTELKSLELQADRHN